MSEKQIWHNGNWHFGESGEVDEEQPEMFLMCVLGLVLA